MADMSEFLILSEMCERSDLTNEIIFATSTSKNANINFVTNKLLKNEESDVYVGSFYEEVVPLYSEATYIKHFRMSRKTMNILYEDISSLYTEENLRAMIVPLDKKIHLTLWLLVNHAISFRAASDLFGLSKGTAHHIFLEVCNNISSLKTKYIKWPNQNAANENAAFVLNKFGIPGVVGHIDGCHIQIKAPKNNPVDFYNRKHFHSVVLQGVCDNNLRFIDVFIGMTGRVHDARVFRNSPLYEKLAEGFIPPDKHILGDSAYPLSQNLLTPYRNNGFLNRQQIKYNKKHAGARSAIERAFGLLKGKFRRLFYLDMTLLNEIPIVIGACCVLHNILLKYDGFSGVSEDENEDLHRINVDAGEEDNHINIDGQNKRDMIAQSL